MCPMAIGQGYLQLFVVIIYLFSPLETKKSRAQILVLLAPAWEGGRADGARGRVFSLFIILDNENLLTFS